MSETSPPGSADDSPEDLTRRHFIEHVGFMSGTALLYAACKPSEPKKSEATVGPVVETSHRSLTNDEYDTVAAAVERICPRDEEPGAIDLGVPEYIDRALATPTLAHVRDDFVRGTEVLMRRAQGRYRKAFAALGPAEQNQLLTEFKDSPGGSGEQHYWTVLIGLTMEGLFGDPVARRQPRRPRLGAHRLRKRTAGMRRSLRASPPRLRDEEGLAGRWRSPRWTRWWWEAARAARPWRWSWAARASRWWCSRRGRTTRPGGLRPRRDPQSAAATSSCRCRGTSRTWCARGQSGKYARTNHAWTANCVGGGTVHMSGYFYRLKPVDFRLRSMLGAVKGAHAGGLAHPLRGPGALLRAGRGRSWASPARPRRTPSPSRGEGPTRCRRWTSTPSPRRSTGWWKELGWHPLPPRAASSAGRTGAARRAPTARCAAATAARRREGEHQRHADPRGARHRQRGAAPAVHGAPRGGRRQGPREERRVPRRGRACAQEQPAKIVVVSCTAVESARLLLNSRPAASRGGWPTTAGWWARTWSSARSASRAPRSAVASRRRRWPWLDDPAPFVQRSLQDFYLMPDDEASASARAGRWASCGRTPTPSSRRSGWPGAARRACSARRSRTACARTGTRKILQFEIYGEFLPTAGTYVSRGAER